MVHFRLGKCCRKRIAQENAVGASEIWLRYGLAARFGEGDIGFTASASRFRRRHSVAAGSSCHHRRCLCLEVFRGVLHSQAAGVDRPRSLATGRGGNVVGIAVQAAGVASAHIKAGDDVVVVVERFGVFGNLKSANGGVIAPGYRRAPLRRDGGILPPCRSRRRLRPYSMRCRCPPFPAAQRHRARPIRRVP